VTSTRLSRRPTSAGGHDVAATSASCRVLADRRCERRAAWETRGPTHGVGLSIGDALPDECVLGRATPSRSSGRRACTEVSSAASAGRVDVAGGRLRDLAAVDGHRVDV
jgi:hypothetical protein